MSRTANPQGQGRPLDKTSRTVRPMDHLEVPVFGFFEITPRHDVNRGSGHPSPRPPHGTNLLDDFFPRPPPLTRRFNALSTPSLLALFHKQSGLLGLEMEPSCFPCGQNQLGSKKSNRGPDPAGAEPAGGGNRKEKLRRHDTLGKSRSALLL